MSNSNPTPNAPATVHFGGNHLTVQTGKMSFVQYGFEDDPGPDGGSFHPDQVVLLVLNNSRSVVYEFEDASGHTSSYPSSPESPPEDYVVILWPRDEGMPPDDLAPEKLFEHVKPKKNKRWPREYFQTGNRTECWNTALVFKDQNQNYAYRCLPNGGSDTYLFSLKDLDVVPWIWERSASGVEGTLRRLLGDSAAPLLRAVEARAGGPQQTNGGLPYPPK